MSGALIMVATEVEGQITFEVKNTRPVELLDLTASLAALGREYLRHLEQEHPEASASEVRLYVNEIRTGSIVATMIAASPQIVQMASYTLSVISFADKLSKAYAFLTGKNANHAAIEKKTLQNLSSIVEPIAKDGGSQLNIGTNNGVVVLKISSTDASEAQNTINRLLNEGVAKNTGYHTKVLLYWFQARADASSTSGDRGIIESISDAPVKVICVDERIKHDMVLEDQNPFREAYIVDVAVETIRGKPALYKVMALHEKIPREN
jgi:ligand-binding sensor domain-containing protein